MKDFEFTEKTIYNIIIFVYLLIGILYVIFDKVIPSANYMSLIIFFTFKMLTNYRKCTFSYIECKLRNVKKQDGYIYDFLQSIIGLKDTQHSIYIYLVGIIFIIVHFKNSFQLF